MKPAATERKSEKGSTLIIIAAGAVALFGMLALAIDVGYMMTTNAELKNAADAGSMSASRELARIYDTLGGVDRAKYELTTSDKSRILDAANKYTQQNQAAGEEIAVTATDLTYGKWDGSTGALAAVSSGVTAVRVTTRRDENSNGTVATIFGGVLGKDSFSASAQSGAALGGPSEVPRGTGTFPVGISKHWFEAKDSPCGQPNALRLYPTGTLAGCAGWHTFTHWPANAAHLRNILVGMKSGTYTSPATTIGETNYAFIGGAIGADFPEMKQLFNSKKGADGTWVVQVPVYESSDCSNPNGWKKIVGYATARITNIVEAPDKQIDGQVECDIIPVGKAGGPDFGTLVAAPTVIQ